MCSVWSGKLQSLLKKINEYLSFSILALVSPRNTDVFAFSVRICLWNRLHLHVLYFCCLALCCLFTMRKIFFFGSENLNLQTMFIVLTLNLWPGHANSTAKIFNRHFTCNNTSGKSHRVLRTFPTSIWLLLPKAHICDNQHQIRTNVQPLI